MRTLAVAAACLLAACTASSGEDGGGFLVVAGGAVRRDNAAIYERFVRLAGPRGRLGILPTASGQPQRSVESAEEILRWHGAEGEVDVLELGASDAAAADDPDFCARVGALDGVWISGGSQSRIADALRPDGRTTKGLEAMQALLDRGGVIGGSSAGAAVMSEVMISGGRSEDALVHGVRAAPGDPGVGLAPGLGLFPWGIVDQHFLARGRLGRLVVALRASGIERGWGVDEDGGLLADLVSGDVTALGPCALLLVDLSEAEAFEGGVRGARLALLSTGDRVHGPTGRVLPRPARRPLRAGEAGGFARRARPRQDLSAPLEPWEPDAVQRLLDQLAAERSRPAIARGGGSELELRADARTRLLTGLEESVGPCAVDVVLSLRVP